MTPTKFLIKYGPWALVAGASDGLGAAFARRLAALGFNLVLIARRADKLSTLGDELQVAYGVRVVVEARDLKDAGLETCLAAFANDFEIGLAVYNAAFAPVGALLERSLEDLLTAVDVNVRGPLIMTHTLAPAMVRRERGGVLLMSSLSGIQGTPRLATYAGTKAFNNVFGESIWHELRQHHVDVAVCCAGAIRTPGYQAAASKDAPGTLDAEVVATEALEALGRGPRCVPGLVNRTASVLLGRVLPRRLSVNIMATNTRDLT